MENKAKTSTSTSASASGVADKAMIDEDDDYDHKEGIEVVSCIERTKKGDEEEEGNEKGVYKGCQERKWSWFFFTWQRETRKEKQNLNPKWWRRCRRQKLSEV